ncbi:MAG: hypothetical protein KKF46_00465 [Nanoarchaeota archaeon]|nr:hypothetical protein [Nanoarchaeota archaeon]MBU1320807.1 hypothetical protein [Nanoarchaeota archaeon]MBU1596816.1 hypothetical protein [Nanoarchaeota archaeon]MBU2440885.1 hypothetical protein [Nanoarchaeota archaeon]
MKNQTTVDQLLCRLEEIHYIGKCGNPNCEHEVNGLAFAEPFQRGAHDMVFCSESCARKYFEELTKKKE